MKSPSTIVAFPQPEAPLQMSSLRDREIAGSTEFVCEWWGRGEGVIAFYAPVTREKGAVWIHPTWARSTSWEEMTRRATRIWGIRGSLWNPRDFTLLYARETEPAALLRKAA